MTVSPAPVTSDTSRAVARRAPSSPRGGQPHAAFAERDEHAADAGARHDRPGRLARLVWRADAPAGCGFGLDVVGRHQRGAAIELEVRHLGVDQQRQASLVRAGDEVRHQASRHHALLVVGDQQGAGAVEVSIDDGHEAVFGGRVEVAIGLVVDSRHLLVAAGHHPHLRGGPPIGHCHQRRRRSGRAPPSPSSSERPSSSSPTNAREHDAAAQRATLWATLAAPPRRYSS